MRSHIDPLDQRPDTLDGPDPMVIVVDPERVVSRLVADPNGRLWAAALIDADTGELIVNLRVPDDAADTILLAA